MRRIVVRSALVPAALLLLLYSAPLSANAEESCGCGGDKTAEPQQVSTTKPRQLPSGGVASMESTSCICVIEMIANMGYTQIYRAVEYYDCEDELCDDPHEVWHSGYQLPTNQQCPNCINDYRLAALKRKEPQLAAAKPADFDLRDGDKEISLNPELDATHDPDGFGQPRVGTILHPDDGRPMSVKVFAMKVNGKRPTTLLFGVEVDHVDEPEFRDLPAKRSSNMKYAYEFEIDGVWQHCLVVATR